MKKKTKKILALIMAFVLTFSSGLAASAEELGEALGISGVENVGIMMTGEEDNSDFLIDKRGVLVKYYGTGTKVDIPDSVTSIGDSAFVGCSELTSVKIPEGVTRIGKYAFSDCSSLTSVEIPESVTDIGCYAFCDCTSLESVCIFGNITAVREDTFSGCSSLTSVALPDSVTTIGDRAFGNCTRLPAIEIPAKVTEIGESAFNSCLYLTDITIPAGVTSIGDWCFSECIRLTNISIPDSVSDMGEWVFNNCAGLSDDNGFIIVSDILFDTVTNKLAENVVIPDGVTKIHKQAFYRCSKMTSVEIPESVTSIGDRAFGATGLKEIKIPDSVMDLGEYVFIQCSSLTSVSLPKNVTDISAGLFYNCTSLKEIEIPTTVTSIGKAAFMGSGLNSIIIPESVTGIGEAAFSSCSSLSNVEIPDSVNSIGIEAFKGCSSITGIELPKGLSEIADYTFQNCTSLKSIEIPDNVTRIGKYGFNNCSGLTEIVMPDTVTETGEKAFYKCTGLADDDGLIIINHILYGVDSEKIIENESIPVVSVPEGVIVIGDDGFSGFDTLVGVELPHSVTTIGNYAFSGCELLEGVELPDSVTSIGVGAFSNCIRLGEMKIPDGVTFIGGNTFYNCTSLKHIEIPAGVTACGNRAFYGCTWLGDENGLIIANNVLYGVNFNNVPKNLVIPDGVTAIGNNAFFNCSNIVSVELPESVRAIGNSAFSMCQNLVSVKLSDGIISIGENAFYNDNYLSDIVLPDSVTEIGRYAFSGCSSLTGIRIPCSVTYIEQGTFYQCKGLTAIEIPDSVRGIGELAFSLCSGLSYVEIPDSVTEIGDGAFKWNSNLTGVFIPDSVTYMGKEVFFGGNLDSGYNVQLVVYGSSESKAESCMGVEGVSFLAISEPEEITLENPVISREDFASLITRNKIASLVIKTGKAEFLFKPGWLSLFEDRESYDFSVEIDSKYSSGDFSGGVTEENFIAKVIYGYSGNFPGTTAIKLFLGTDFAGNEMNYALLNEDGTLSESRIGFVDEDGCLTVIQSHCSAYVITKVIKSSGEEDGSGDGEKTEQPLCVDFTCNNLESQQYEYNWADVINSHLTVLDNGYMRFQSDAVDGYYLAEYYDTSYNLLSYKMIPQELEIFGGFYATEENYYVVSGQKNREELADREVYRITKYDKDWKRISSAGLKDCNTTVPFDAGSCRMAHSGKYLVIHTCHEMYTASDGRNHQANVTIQVDMETMTITDSYTSVGNAAYYGYVSHSFNQFIEIEDNKIITVDHGDAYPRSIELIIYPKDMSDGKFQMTYPTRYTCEPLMTFQGEIGNNYTGATTGGFQISDSAYLVAGTSTGTELYGSSTRNVFVCAMSKSTGKVKTFWFTDYGKGEITARNPHLVDLGNNSFLLMWSRGNEVFYTKIDGDGYQDGKIYSFGGHLSDCEPQAVNGKVIWYTCEGFTNVFYEINTSNLEDYNIKLTSSKEICGHNYRYKQITDGYVCYTCKKCGEEIKKILPSYMDKNLLEDTVNYTSFDGKLEVGQWKQLTVVLNPYECDENITVTVSDASVVSASAVDGKVYLRALKEGKATITVASMYNPDLKTSVSVVVKNKGEEDSGESVLDDFDINDGVLTRYKGNGKIITIPDSVVKIADYAFSEKTTITSVTMPDSVTDIGNFAFEGCTNLETIKLSEGLKKIGDSAFTGCSNLGAVTFPESLTEIGELAFYQCTSLKRVQIPDTVTKMGNAAFYMCSGLEEVVLSKGITEIPQYTFSGTGLKKVEIPEGVTMIGMAAFMECPDLEMVTLPGTLKKMCQGAFKDCTSLTEIELPEGLNYLEGYEFAGCTGLKSIKFPESLSYISRNMFKDCTSLETITIPDSIKKIEAEAFAYCTNLKNITLPKDLEVVEYALFRGCTSLTTIKIPDTVTTIAAYAFYDCTSLKELQVSESLTNFVHYAFYNCTGLSDENGMIIINNVLVQVMNDNRSGAIIIPDGVKIIGSGACYDFRNITSVTIPDSVEIIRDNAFYFCWSLKELTIPESVSKIENSAFYACAGLIKVNILGNPSYIGEYAFRECTRLADDQGLVIVNGILFDIDERKISGNTIVVPYGVKAIDSMTFYGCDKLTSIVVPDSVTTIGADAFSNVEGLTIYGHKNSYVQRLLRDRDEYSRLSFEIIPSYEYNSGESPVLSKETVEVLVGENKDKDVRIKITDGEIVFKYGTMHLVENVDSYDFSYIKNTVYDESGLPDITEGEFVASISFNYSGELPGVAEARISLGSESAGKIFTCYRIQEDGSLGDGQEIQADEDGCISMERLDETYIITEKISGGDDGTVDDGNGDGTEDGDDGAVDDGNGDDNGDGDDGTVDDGNGDDNGDGDDGTVDDGNGDDNGDDNDGETDDGTFGDANGDGVIDSNDALAILKHVAKMQLLSEEEQSRADVQADNQIDSNDALKILKYVAKMITTLE